MCCVCFVSKTQSIDTFLMLNRKRSVVLFLNGLFQQVVSEGPKLQWLLKFKYYLPIDISTLYCIAMLCAVHMAKCHCDLQNAWNNFEFKKFETLFFVS